MAVTFKAVAKGRLFSTIETRNIFYAQIDSLGAELQADINVELGEWIVNVLTPLAADLSALFNLYEADVYKWTTEWTPCGSVALSFAGSAGAENAMPSQVAVVLIARTLVKRVFARKFLAGLASARGLDGVLTTTVLAHAAASMVAWITPFAGDITSLEYVPGTWLKTNVFQPFISGIADAILGTMRRRKIGVGI